MANTIRTYRKPSGSPDTPTLVDTEVDADEGDFSVTVDTSGWPAGTYDIQCSAQKDAEAESALSNAVAVVVTAVTNNANIIPSAEATSVGVGSDYAVTAGGTVTHDFAAGPTGAFDGASSRLQAAGYDSFSLHRYLSPNTQYTASWWARENGAGSSQAGARLRVRDPDSGAILVDWTAYPTMSTSDQRVSVTFTTGASGEVNILYYYNNADVAAEILAWGMKVEPGATATGTPAQLAPGQP